MGGMSVEAEGWQMSNAVRMISSNGGVCDRHQLGDSSNSEPNASELFMKIRAG
jgi:hypothetical protein